MFNWKIWFICRAEKNAGYYIGAMQVGDEQVVICRYLSNTELSVRDFLLKKS